MNKLTVKDLKDLEGKRVLLRCDFNVPMKDGKIADETRIKGALPTIEYLLEKKAKVVLCSHLGKPHSIFSDEIKLSKKERELPEEEKARIIEKAKREDREKFTLLPVAKRLNELLGGKVAFASDVIGPDAREKVSSLKEGECVLLENLRFHWEEEQRELEFCKKLASFCEIYVNDAFGTAHRSHASTAAIVEYGLVKTAVCGFLVEKELSVMADCLERPARPFIAILGGAKVKDKLGVISNLLEKCDALLIGGGMAYTFLKAQGFETGSSLVDEEKLDYCKEALEKAKAERKEILLPSDAVISKSFPEPIDAPIETETVSISKIPTDRMGLDIGEETIARYREKILSAKTILWNGPMGVFENPCLSKGTIAIAQALADAKGATTIVGGGDSAAACVQFGFADKITHISTGGGASLELFEGKTLPGIACLNEKKEG